MGGNTRIKHCHSDARAPGSVITRNPQPLQGQVAESHIACLRGKGMLLGWVGSIDKVVRPKVRWGRTFLEQIIKHAPVFNLQADCMSEVTDVKYFNTVQGSQGQKG